MRRLLLLTLLIPSLAFGQTVKLSFPDDSPKKVWTTQSAQESTIDFPSMEVKEFTLDSLDDVVCILDEASGNLAVRPSQGLSSWTVKPSDFSLIGRVQVRGEPAPTTASYSCQGQTVLVIPGGQPTASFYGLKPGKIDVSVTYSVGGKNATKRQSFEVGLKRSEPIPRLLISLEGADAPSKTDSPATPKPKSEGGIVGKLAAVVIVGVFAAAILIFGLRWIYSNQDKAQDALGKLGVQVPDALDPQPDPGSAPANPVQGPTPMKPIVLDDGGLSSIPAAPVSGTARLSGVAGNFELTEGVHVIGREAGLTISLVGESTVSRLHAEIVVSGDSIVLRDLGSTNGTFLDGEPVNGDAPLRRGALVRFGSVQFKVD